MLQHNNNLVLSGGVRSMRRSETSIKTGRMWLRQIDATDAESIVALRSDESVYRYFLNPTKLTVDSHRSWYEKQYKIDTSRIDWIAVDDETGDFIGVYGAKKESSDTVEISYITNRDKQGFGYAKEAVKAIIDWCENNWNVNSFEVNIHRSNIPSISFAKRIGFVKFDSAGGFIRMRKKWKGMPLEKDLLKLLGDRDVEIVNAHISHLHQICDEIIGRYEEKSLNNMVYESFLPVRLKGNQVSQILKNVNQRFRDSFDDNIKTGDNINDLNRCANQLDEFTLLVEKLENALDRFLYIDQNGDELFRAAQKVKAYL